MRQVKLTQTGVGITPPVIVDSNRSPFQVTWAVYVNNDAPVTYSVQYTHDDLFITPDADVVWWMTACDMTTHANHSLDSPIKAVRLSVESGGADGVVFTINQGVGR